MNRAHRISSMKNVLFPLSVTLAVALTGCAIPSISERVAGDHAAGSHNISAITHAAALAAGSSGDVAGGAQDAERRAAEQRSNIVLRRSNRPWVASVSVPMGSNEKLPSVFQEPVKLNFNDTGSGGKVSIRTVAERIAAATGVPVRVKPDVFNEPAPGGRSTGVPGAKAPASFGAPSAAVSPEKGAGRRVDGGPNAVAMRWNGSLEGFLNHITDITNAYLKRGDLRVERFGRGFAWLDTGTHESLLDASQYVQTIENRQGLKVACLEEIAFNQGWISREELLAKAEKLKKTGYGQYLGKLAKESA